MVHAVPSQVRSLIERLFPETPTGSPLPGEVGGYNAAYVAAVLDLLDRVPEELIRLSGDDFAMFWANVSSLRAAKLARSATSDNVRVMPIRGCNQRPLGEIYRLLGLCPDEAPVSPSKGLEFITDAAFRESLLIDVGAANSALVNHEYKASTVLAGSVVEALLLWALQTEGEPNVRAAVRGAPSKPFDDWTLESLISAAHSLGIISDDTKTQAKLAQSFRNLIHPGRQQRLKDRCDRGTALAALAAVERVIADLRKKYGPP